MPAAKKRSGTADRVAQVLRDEIAKGMLPPGVRLSEEAFGARLGVARNTLREAFRVLAQEGLVVHVLNRGVFVRQLTAEDISDVYRLRRAIEIEAISPSNGQPFERLDLAPLRSALERVDAAALAGDWAGVGTANLEFHASLVDLARSERLSQAMGRLLAELRLAFQMAANIDELNANYMLRGKMLFSLLEEGNFKGAAAALRAYLIDSEADILKAYAKDRAQLD